MSRIGFVTDARHASGTVSGWDFTVSRARNAVILRVMSLTCREMPRNATLRESSGRRFNSDLWLLVSLALSTLTIAPTLAPSVWARFGHGFGSEMEVILAPFLLLKSIILRLAHHGDAFNSFTSGHRVRLAVFWRRETAPPSASTAADVADYVVLWVETAAAIFPAVVVRVSVATAVVAADVFDG